MHEGYDNDKSVVSRIIVNLKMNNFEEHNSQIRNNMV